MNTLPRFFKSLGRKPCLSVLSSRFTPFLAPKTQSPVFSARRLADWPYLYSNKPLAMAPQLDSYFKQVDDMAESFIERLRKAVAIPSVSADDERRPDVVRVSHNITFRPL